ncbi:MAG TPA: ABC transporter permease [Thermoplasmata archaeon]|nr:ABC transporter permease [Thermoplasmata archaeon]HUJ77593.1 ABC transporter permease [Thermoplasmata archaeon]
MAADGAAAAPAPARPARARRGATVRGVLSVLRANPLTFVGFLLVAAIVGLAVLVEAVPLVTGLFGPPVHLYPYDPVSDFSGPRLAPPSAAHWLGTDDNGHDLFSRALAALPIDLSVGFAISGFGLVVGGALGLVAGYWTRPWSLGGAVSTVILRLTDIFLSIPTLLLALAIVEVLSRGYLQTIFALMVTWWPYYTRLVRGEVLSIKQQPYVTAAKAAGVSDGRILRRHVLRNLLEPVIVYYTMDVGTVIVVFSTIAFIGATFPPYIPEWGTMVEGYADLFPAFPWPVISMSVAIIVTVLAFSLLGDGLRDLLDPRSRRVLAQTGAAGEAP